MIQKNELMIGSILNYDTAEGDILPTTIDWQDLKWISEDHKGFNLCHSPIPLTEEILLKCGFKLLDKDYTNQDFNVYTLGDFYYNTSHNKFWFINSYRFKQPKYLHELQNLYFALTGKELEINL